MTDQPYTDEDLRAEASRQHHDLTDDPDFMGVGEQMENAWVPSVETTEDGSARTWAELLDPEQDGTEAYDEAQQKICHLINHAADVSEWAVNLGADGLQPSPEHAITIQGGDKPIARIHFAFEPGMSEEMRTALVEGLGDAIADAL